jgi:hypothetical protein
LSHRSFLTTEGKDIRAAIIVELPRNSYDPGIVIFHNQTPNILVTAVQADPSKRGDHMNRFDRTTKILLALLVVGVWCRVRHPDTGVAAALGQARPGPQAFEEISTQRLNIVDDKGKARIVLSNADKFPNPIIDGKEMVGAAKPVGIVFYNATGNECGGIALNSTDAGEQNALILNYTNSEAIGFGKFESKEGSYSAGVSVLDRIPLKSDTKKTGKTGIERIIISNNNGNAELSISDPQGKPRIRLSVDARGAANIHILDQKGKELYRAVR